MHNVSHHEGVSAVDRWGYRELARRSDVLVCFSHAAARELRRANPTAVYEIRPIALYLPGAPLETRDEG